MKLRITARFLISNPITNFHKIFARSITTRIAEVGSFESQKPKSIAYDSGQLFLHRSLGYRGVVLFSWNTKVYDKDLHKKNSRWSLKSSLDTANIFSSMDFEPSKDFWYQTLIDERDWPYVRYQIGSLAHLSVDNSQREYLGLDYVDHDDIWPYSSKDYNQCLVHNMLDSFLVKSLDNDLTIRLRPTDLLRVWSDENREWLELSSVYRETTNDIRVTVIPFYMGRSQDHEHDFYWWRYCTRLENLNREANCILREREWKIISCTGKLETIRGKGILSMEPILADGSRAFQYSSRISLTTPSGQMWGCFKMERESGKTFEVKVPPFILLSEPIAESKIDKPI